jgi:hypothetical protein
VLEDRSSRSRSPSRASASSKARAGRGCPRRPRGRPAQRRRRVAELTREDPCHGCLAQGSWTIGPSACSRPSVSAICRLVRTRRDDEQHAMLTHPRRQERQEPQRRRIGPMQIVPRTVSRRRRRLLPSMRRPPGRTAATVSASAPDSASRPKRSIALQRKPRDHAGKGRPARDILKHGANVFTYNTCTSRLPLAPIAHRGVARTCSRATRSRHGGCRGSSSSG